MSLQEIVANATTVSELDEDTFYLESGGTRYLVTLTEVPSAEE